MNIPGGVPNGNPNSLQRHPDRIISGARLGAVLLVATAYLIAAWAGKLLASSGAYASPLWPAAGLALAALLKGGMGSWPGIWLGACIFMLWSQPSLAGVVPALLVATGATLQALLGARLAKPLFQRSNPLAHERDVLAFLLRTGPLACLIVPSVTALVFFTTGSATAPGELGSQWLTLWIGDTLGVVLFAPLTMLVWPGAQRLWTDNWLRLSLPLATTAVLLTAGYVGLEHLEQSRRGEVVANYQEEVYRTGLPPLASIFESVNGVERFFAASADVSREEFATFTSFAVAKPEIHSLDWAPRVPHAGLADFVAKEGQDGMDSYRVFELDAAGRPAPLSRRADYFPVRFSEPRAENARVLGLDHGFEATRRAAMDAARDSAVSGIAVVSLVRTDRRALLVFQPVYRKGFMFRNADAATRRKALRGFVVAVLDIERMFAPLHKVAAKHSIAFRVTDMTTGDLPKVLTDSLPAGSLATWHHEADIAGRRLRIDIASAANQVAAGSGVHFRVYHFLALLAGLLVSFATLTSAGRQAATNAEVEARTAELEHARRDAEQASQAKSAFLATMSHEIRTPMNGVLGTLEVLEHSSLSEHQRDQVQTMRDSAITLLALIDDILDFSKIEAGRIELEQAPLCVADLVEGLGASQLSVARRRGVSLRVFVAPEIPECIMGDDARLRQVLYNLAGNAIKFSAGNPARAGRVELRATLAARAPLTIAFTIKDNGIGMDEAALCRLFTPFTQAETSTTRRFGGTGLGLTISRRLVDLMGGEINVVSQPDQGSIFTVTLPFALAPEQPVREQPDLSGLLCFLLDDADIDSEAVTRYLACAGATVRRCADVKEAMRYAATAESPVVLIHAEGESRRWRDGDISGHLRRVCIGHGRRQRARLDSTDCVSIDGDALRRQAFLRAVAVAAGRASPEVFDDRSTDAPPGESTPPSVAQARAESRLILVAEDDSVNQKVVLQQLALLGYAAEVTGDGAEALARWRDGGFALLFTDLHMPVMDGYQLAAEIRRLESGGRRMPIIALTANALHGEVARAKVAGMDDYLTKPVTLTRLLEVLEAWLPPGGMAVATEPARVLDVRVLRRLVGDDPAVLDDFLSDYARTAGRSATELRAAAMARDYLQIAATAHKLKSSSRSVGALPLGDLCAELENAGTRNDGPAVAHCMAQFEALFATVEEELASLLSEERKT